MSIRVGNTFFFFLAEENHRIIELEGFLWIMECRISLTLTKSQAWCSDFLPGKPAPGDDHPFSEKPFPNVISESPLRELRYYYRVI